MSKSEDQRQQIEAAKKEIALLKLSNSEIYKKITKISNDKLNVLNNLTNLTNKNSKLGNKVVDLEKRLSAKKISG